MTLRVSKLRAWHLGALALVCLQGWRGREDVAPSAESTPLIVSAAASAVPGLTPDAHGYAAWSERGIAALALAEFVPDRRRANLSGLALTAAAGGQTADERGHAATAALVERLTADAAERGYVSIFARLPSGSRFRGVFGGMGFAHAASEDVYARPPGPAADPEPIEGLRPVEQADAWDVAQLYRTITPASLQLAEAPGGERPSAPRRRFLLSPGRGEPQRFIVAGEHGADGWVSLHAANRGRHTAALMTHPRRRELTLPLLRFAVWSLASAAQLPIRVVVHPHEDALRRAAEAEGFVKTDVRDLLVKHMTIRIAAAVPTQAFDRATS